MSLTEQQQQAMLMEISESQYLVGQAIKMLGVSLHHYTGGAALMFATGIEKLMKLILILDGETDVRRYGHDLEKLVQAITTKGLWEDEAFLDEQLVQKLISAMNHMSGAGRYRNVDFLQDIDNFVPPADLLLSLINFNMLVDDQSNPISNGPLAQLEATMWNQEKIVRALFGWMKAVSRTLASPSSRDRWEICGELGKWIYVSEDDFMTESDRSGMPPAVVKVLVEQASSPQET